MEKFTQEEEGVLLRYCSNVDKPVFALKNLPEAIKGALFSRYSRSTKSLRRLLLDEFLYSPESGLSQFASAQQGPDISAAASKAEAFYDRVLDGYGDDSVGELGGAHLAIEDVSIVSTKIIQDSRIGGSPLEKSTRYVYFDSKRDGKWLYYREPRIMASAHSQQYERVMDMLFETYSGLVPRLAKYVEEVWPIGEFEFSPDRTGPPVKFGKLSDEKAIKRATNAYNSSVRAKVCDALRYILPASTITNTGIYGNGRFWQAMITRMYSNPLAESQALAQSIHSELGTVIKPFVRRAAKDEYISSRESSMQQFASGFSESPERVRLVDYDRDAEIKVIAMALFPYCHESMESLVAKVVAMGDEERKAVVDAYAGGRRTRRDRPGRAFEQSYYDFEFCADFGAYRDIHRHRVLTQERQLLTCRHGFETPQEIIDGGFEPEYKEAMVQAAQLFLELEKDMPHEAQYVVPLGYRIRWRMKMNLREAYHLAELRSGMQGHDSYRRIAQDICSNINRVHPLLASHMKFMDMKSYPLGRLAAEMKKENKRESS